MAKLVAHTGHLFDLPTIPLSFGEEITNDIVVPKDYGLAANHFVLWPKGKGHVLRDSGSGRGCWVNGSPVMEAELYDGDEIVAGNLKLRYQCPEMARPAKVMAPEMPSFLDPLPEQFAAKQAQAVQEERETKVERLPKNTGRPPSRPMTEARTLPPTWLADEPEQAAANEPAQQPRQPQTMTTKSTVRWKWIATTATLMAASSASTWFALKSKLPTTEQQNTQPALAQTSTSAPPAPGRPVQTSENTTLVSTKPSAKPTENLVERAVAKAPEMEAKPAPEPVASAPVEASEHFALLEKHIFPAATTLYSVKYPDAEILFVNHALKRGLPYPQQSAGFLERALEMTPPAVERISSIHDNPDQDGVLIVSLREPWPFEAALAKAGKKAEKQTWAGQDVFIYTRQNGDLVAVGNLKNNLLIAGPENIVKAALETPLGTGHGLLPNSLAGDLGSFLWTVKCDDSIVAQLRANQAKKSDVVDLASVESVAFRYKTGAAQPSLCFAQRRTGASEQAFAKDSVECLENMVRMIESQALSKAADVAAATQAKAEKDTATKAFAGGKEFVNLFLEGHFRPAVQVQSTVALAEKARRLAHMLNMAANHGVLEIASAATAQAGLEILNTGVPSRKINNLEFQVTTTPEERLSLAVILEKQGNIWGCRMTDSARQRKDAARLEEAINRLNADTVLNIVPSPSSEKIIKIPDLRAYIGMKLQSLQQQSQKKGDIVFTKMFGMPMPNEKELDGILDYIEQNSRGQLAQKQGEIAWSEWSVPKAAPEDREADTISALVRAAVQAGNKELTRIKTANEAVQLLTQGVKGDGDFYQTVFQYEKPQEAVLSAALGKLSMHEGELQNRAAQ